MKMKYFDLIQTCINNSDHKTSRRTFLKSSGLAIICMGFFPIHAKANQPVNDTPDGLKQNENAYAPGFVLGNMDLCGGCRRCEIVCSALKNRKTIRAGSSLIKLDRKRFEFLFKKFLPVWYPDTCRQCKENEDSPWCVKACPTGACHIESKTKISLIDRDICIGCGSCVEACPYKMAIIDTMRPTNKAPDGTASKCDLCQGEPECVLECPSSALRFYTF
jgi:Fe-S-cluster-containing dehydrogenase component